ncbi:hypothetical protein EYW49_00815 [Siculibacillus lacustris]|uniref:Nitroreductase domain-containing protein n=1 Tax=Siculibacillus lacustris TaxID=1549641 RepID=A0A4Q9VXS6_9HYPH|nr:nitroreductase family protein [Siculibacillus lacustris]TBW41299.1 hypothetical protein EYW49_00815 [Siculibacillus lacustris]
MSAPSARKTDHPILPLFVERWSPRAFTGETIPDTVLASLFEAARWAPSAYNSQPWRFVWAKAGTPEWGPLFGLLNEFNQGWARSASAIVLVLSKSTFRAAPDAPEQAAGHHAFDTGAAWVSLALQAHALGWSAHAAAGFDADRARSEFALPADVHPQAVVVIGRAGDPASLPDALRARETPNGRRPVTETAFHGRYPA